jgi:hypothetical protein
MLFRDDRLRILFLHHSTGRGLIEQGGVRALFAERNARDGTKHEFWDHDYNEIGLTGPTGERTGRSFGIPDDDTDPVGLDRLFSQPVHDPPDNALSHILQFDVVAFKSCFPICAIRSEAQLEQYKQHYLAIRETIKRHPHTLFIVMTPPPLIPRSIAGLLVARGSRWMWTGPEEAARARRFARWLCSEEFLMGLPNAVAFDYFDLLAEPSGSGGSPNTLRAEYRGGRFGYDAHPNEAANKAVAPLFVDAIWKGLKRLRQSPRRALAGVS